MLSAIQIAKLSISPEQIYETASFFACWYKFTNIKSWLESPWWGMVKNECGQSGLWNLKLIVAQERTDGTHFLHTGTISHKLRDDREFLG